MTPACDHCRYFHRRMSEPESEETESIEGECRRHPPQVGDAVEGQREHRLGLFPRVLIFQWCGEFKAKSADSKRG